VIVDVDSAVSMTSAIDMEEFDVCSMWDVVVQSLLSGL